MTTPTPNVGGRPKLPENERLKARFVIRTTEAQHATWERAARSEGMPPSLWARRILNKAAQEGART